MLSTGTVLVGAVGKYRIISELRQGSMATVYAARRVGDESSNEENRVAVKVPLPKVQPIGLLRARFEAERGHLAQLTNLGHSGLVQLLDRGACGHGWPFLVMDMVDGSPLDEIVEEGVFPVPGFWSISASILKSLAGIHDVGIIHRDVKPANIMLTDAGGIVILDFGLAHSELHPYPVLPTGKAVGTPAYMSPEQARGKVGDSKTDIFSAGCLFYELLTGMPAIPISGSAEDVIAWLTRKGFSGISPLIVHGLLSRLIYKMTSPEPGDRPTAREALQMLHDAEQYSPHITPVCGGCFIYDKGALSLSSSF